jgi:hypothetical protein
MSSPSNEKTAISPPLFVKTDYAVGYGKPPIASRFKPGQSGNPKGRPKGSMSARTLLDKALSTTITITENGMSRTVQHREALFKSLTAKALKGDMRSLALIIKLMDLYKLDTPHEKVTKIVRVIVSPDEAKM